MDHTKALAFLKTTSPNELLIVKAFYETQRSMTERELCERTGLHASTVKNIMDGFFKQELATPTYPDWDECYWIFGKWAKAP